MKTVSLIDRVFATFDDLLRLLGFIQLPSIENKPLVNTSLLLSKVSVLSVSICLLHKRKAQI